MKIRIGIGIGTQSFPTDGAFLELCQEMERIGFDSIWLSERLTGPAFDPIVSLAYAAGGTKKLNFFNSTSGSNSGVSRMIEMEVPGNGIINFGTGGKIYEILSITDTQLHLRSKGVDGNAWYIKLKAQ